MNKYEATDKVIDTLIMMYTGERSINNSEELRSKFSDTSDYKGCLEFGVESIFDIKLGLFDEAFENDFNSGLYYELTIQEFKTLVKQKYLDSLIRKKLDADEAARNSQL